VEQLARHVPSGQALFVTADHGMVNVRPEQRVDVADRPELLEGVRFLGGEPRARHVYARPGADEDVVATWREILGDRMWVLSGSEAIQAGWFGPRVRPEIAERVGSVVAAAFALVGVFQRAVDPMLASLLGQHGSMTAPEQDVPLLEFRG